MIFDGPLTSNIFYVIVSSAVLISATLLSTYVFTTVRYHLALRGSQVSSDVKPRSPPQIPFTLPWLGNTLAFLAPKPGQFWTKLFSWHPRETGACTIVLGGRSTHIVYNPVTVQHLFKARAPTRDEFNNDVLIKGFGMKPASEVQVYYGYNEPADETGFTPVHQLEKLNQEFLLKTERVNELTAEFIRFLKVEYARELPVGSDEKSKEINLYSWLRGRMFQASTTAFFGERILQIYPDLEHDFYKLDQYILHMFFGVPKFIVPEAYQIREKCIEGAIRWIEDVRERSGGKIPSADGDLSWEPLYGSRYSRAHQQWYEKRGMLKRSRAVVAIGSLFGISSNAVPATGWMLMEILKPEAAGGDPTLLPRITEEIKRAQKADGSIDIPILVNQPLLLSTFHEILRLYTDVLVSRTLPQDIVLPLDETSDSKKPSRSLMLKKDGVVMAPNWLGQRDESLWSNPSADTFYAERFLSSDPSDPDSKPIFTTNGTAGKLFPFGGGKTMCPGRTFAKQEVLASVAMALLEFDFKVLGFVDPKGKELKIEKDNFPRYRDSFQGAGVMTMGGDVRLKMTRRQH